MSLAPRRGHESGGLGVLARTLGVVLAPAAPIFWSPLTGLRLVVELSARLLVLTARPLVLSERTLVSRSGVPTVA